MTGQRISKVLETVDRVAEQTKKRITTSELNKHFGRWVTDLSPPLYRNRAVKMNYITQVSTAPRPLSSLQLSAEHPFLLRALLVEQDAKAVRIRRDTDPVPL